MADEAPPLRVWLYPILAVFIMVSLFLFTAIPVTDPMPRWWQLSNKNLEKALIETTSDTSALVDRDSWLFLNGTRALQIRSEIEDSIFQPDA